MRYEKEVGKKRRVTFRELLEYAQENNWIDNNRFTRAYRNETARRRAERKKSLEAILSGNLDRAEPVPVDPPTEQEIREARNELTMVSGIVEAVPRLRNELAHGSSNLILSSIDSLRFVAEVINQIYESRPQQVAGMSALKQLSSSETHHLFFENGYSS